MDSYYFMENLPYFFIIIFLIITVTILLLDRSNILQISEKQNSLKDKLNDIKIPECPACPEQKECPTLTCPEQKECPSLTCPDTPQCPKCPEHPELNIPSCPDCPECPKNEECPECPKNEECPECPKNEECPKCPDCPSVNNTTPSAQEIANAIFPGRKGSNVLSGNYLPVDQLLKKNMPMGNDNTMSSPKPVMESIPGFLPYANDSYASVNYFPISQMGLAEHDNASGVDSDSSVNSNMDISKMNSLSSSVPSSPTVSEPSSPRTN